MGNSVNGYAAWRAQAKKDAWLGILRPYVERSDALKNTRFQREAYAALLRILDNKE